MDAIKTAKVWIGERKGITSPIHVSQYDTGWTFLLTVYKDDVIYTSENAVTVVMEGLKADGTTFAVPGTFEDGVATIVSTVAMTAAAGIVECELRLSEGGETIGTGNFDLVVEASPIEGGTPSEDDYTAMQTLLDDVAELHADTVENAAAAVAAANTAAQEVLAETPEMVADWLEGNITQETGYVIDKSLTVQGAAADAKATGGKISDIEKWSGIESDYQRATTAGAILYSDGTPYTSYAAITDAYKYSEFLPVSKGATIKYKLRVPSTYCMIAFYTSALTSGYVQSNSVPGTGGAVESVYTVPANGFVVITARNDLTDKYATYSIIGSHNEEVETRLETLDCEITQKVFSLTGQPVENGFLQAGGTFKANVNYRTTGYIPIKSGQSFKYNIGHATALPIICFYASKSEASAQSAKFVTGINGYSNGTYTADADGFVRFCYYYTSTDSYVVFEEHIPDNVKTYLPPNNGVKDLNILCLGDSIFGNDGEIVADLTALSGANVINGAVGGTRVTNRGGTDQYQWFDGVNLIQALTTGVWTNQDTAVQTLTSVAERLATLKAVDMSTVDLITMDWGTNDYTGGQTIEEILAAYTFVIDTLQSAYPSIRILVITPIWRYFGAKTDNENGDNYRYNISTLKEIATAIDNHAKDMRIDSLQMYQKMPLSYNTADLYFDPTSTVHLNATGNMVYAHILNGKIQSMY